MLSETVKSAPMQDMVRRLSHMRAWVYAGRGVRQTTKGQPAVCGSHAVQGDLNMYHDTGCI